MRQIKSSLTQMSAQLRLTILLFSCMFAIASCGEPDVMYGGFSDQGALSKADQYVMAESVGGKLDPANNSKEDQRYEHDHLAYNRMEEGYYQWGYSLYKMGYRDLWYVRDLAPKAFRKKLLSTYDDAIQAGYKAAKKAAGN